MDNNLLIAIKALKDRKSTIINTFISENNEIKAIDIAIKSLSGITDNTKVQETLFIDHKKKNGYHLPIPADYDKNLSWREKTLFILNQIKQGYVPDIIKGVRMYEPDLADDIILQQRIATAASVLYRKKAISAKTVGRSYVYQIKEEDNSNS